MFVETLLVEISVPLAKDRASRGHRSIACSSRRKQCFHNVRFAMLSLSFHPALTTSEAESARRKHVEKYVENKLVEKAHSFLFLAISFVIVSRNHVDRISSLHVSHVALRLFNRLDPSSNTTDCLQQAKRPRPNYR